jgi:hypothetical protein
MIDSVYFKQAELLLRILPLIDREAEFAMKGGTAINFFARDLPRISVDIDLVYLPVGERDESLREISAALVRISQDIKNRIPGTKVTPRKTGGSGLLSGLFVQRQDTIVKIEPNLVIRGSVYPPARRLISPKAIDLFEISVESQILSDDELYAGKICAALDRQHPRDLFDIMMLLTYGNFSTAMRRAFVVYLVSHDRPIVEVLNPGFVDIRPVFETEFQGMTLEEVTCVELALHRLAKKETLRHLGQRQVDDAVVAHLQKRLSGNDKKVLLRDLRYAPAWIAAILRRVSGPEEK